MGRLLGEYGAIVEYWGCGCAGQSGEGVGGTLSRLCMADSGGIKTLGGLCMALKTRYPEYERWNSNVHTPGIRISVPYISHLAICRPRNLPYISEVVGEQWLNNGRAAVGDG